MGADHDSFCAWRISGDAPCWRASSSARAALWLFAEVTEDALHHDPLTRFDLALAMWMRAHDVPIADGVFHYVSLAGSPLVMAILALAGAALLLFRRQWLFASGWLAAFVGGGLLDRVLKFLIRRPVLRDIGSPRVETFNFATGHALGSIIGYGMLAYLVIVFVARVAIQQSLL